MPTLRQFLFLATGLIIGCYLFKSTNLLALDTGALSDTWSLGKECARDKQASLKENQDAYARYVLRLMNDKQKIVEYLSGPVEEYCVLAEIVRGMTRSYQPKYDSIGDSEKICMEKETVDVCERILDLCGICPAKETQPGRYSHPAMTTENPLSTLLCQLRRVSYAGAFRLCFFILAFGMIFWCIVVDFGGTPMIQMISIPRRIVYVEVKGFTWIISFVFMQSAIGVLISLFFDTCGMSEISASIALSFRLLITILICTDVVRLIRNRFFDVDILVEETLMELDHLLHQAKHSLRIVEIRLAAGASRNQLRPAEESALNVLERLKIVKSKYESSLFYRFMCGEFISKVEEAIEVSERIVYLCCPAAAA